MPNESLLAVILMAEPGAKFSCSKCGTSRYTKFRRRKGRLFCTECQNRWEPGEKISDADLMAAFQTYDGIGGGNGVKIQLTGSALEKLIGGDSEVEIELRNSVVQEFTKRYLKGIISEDRFEKFMQAEAEAQRAAVNTLVAEKVGKVTQENYGRSAWVLNEDFLKRVQGCFDEQLTALVRVESERIEKTLVAVVTRNLSEEKFNTTINRLVERTVEKLVVEKMSKMFAK